MPRATESLAEPIPTLLNPGARNASAARAALARDGRFSVIEIQPGAIAETVRQCVDGGASRILVAGGDGTLREAAEILRDGESALAVLPAGTRNHFARDFGIPLDPAAALDLAATGRVRTVDLGLVDEHAILNTSSIGAYAGYVRLRRRLDRWMGYRAASLAAGLVALRRHDRFAVEVTVEGKRLRYEASLVFVGVGERTLERPSPGARRRGGRRALHVFVVHEASRARMARLMTRTLVHGIPFLQEERGLHGFLADACEVHLERPAVTVAMDGELVRLTTPLRYRIARDAVQVIGPQSR